MKMFTSVVMVMTLASLDLRAQAQDPTCWVGGVSQEMCCHADFGVGGNQACWDGYFTYERCCPPLVPTPSEEEVSMRLPAWTPPLAQELVAVGTLANWRPRSECWASSIGTSLTPERCCNTSLGTVGDVSCWDGTHLFARCCIGREHQSDEHLRQPYSPRPPSLDERGDLPPLPHRVRPLGNECWSNGYDWGLCCAQADHEQCFDGKAFTFERCCRRLDEDSSRWSIVRRASPRARCLQEMQGREVVADWRPEDCSTGRVFDVAEAAGYIIDKYGSNNLPWWMRPEESQRQHLAQLGPSRPYKVVHVGSLCVPRVCDIEDVGYWLAPRILPWWRYPALRLIAVNTTHILVPPPLALKPWFIDHDHGWIANRPTWSKEDGGPTYFEFVLHEYRDSWSLHPVHAKALYASAGILVVAALLSALGSRTWVVDAIAPQRNLWRLGKRRGPVVWDAIRLTLTGMVAWIHMVDHGSWAPGPSGSAFLQLADIRHGFKQVNVGFAVLMVNILLTQQRTPRGLVPVCLAIFRHTVKRFFAIAPLVGFWTYVYLHMMTHDIPVNTMLRSPGMQTWHWLNRDTCKHPTHMWASLFLVHDVVFGQLSRCQNSDIFEGLWQTNVVIFILVCLVGSKRFLRGSAMATWIIVLSWCYQKEGGLANFYRGNTHRFGSLLPGALATVFWNWVLPEQWMKRRSAIWVGAIFITWCWFQAWLSERAGLRSEVLAELKDWMGGLQHHVDGWFTESSLWLIANEVLLSFGMVVLMNSTALLRNNNKMQDAGESWSTLAALARLCNGMNAVNLLLCHYVSSYHFVRPLEASASLFTGVLCSTLLASGVLSLLTYLLIEAPIEALVSKIFGAFWPTSASA